MWPRPSKMVSRWMIATIAASIVATMDGGWIASWTALDSSRIWRGQIWRLVTWPFVEPGPMSLVMTAIAIYVFGGTLAIRWGDRRLRRFMLEIVIAAGVVTCLLSALVGAHVFRLGGWAVTDVLVIAWARQFPEAPLRIYGLLVLRGQALVRVTIGIAIVFALFWGPVWMAPELVGCVAAALYPRAWLVR